MSTLETYRKLLRDFTETVPQQLSLHAETIEDAKLIQEHLVELDQKKFRLAVTGKFKQAKSTLINALIGRSLPTVGIEEKTATLNFIGYGQKSEVEHFTIRWKDGTRPDESFPISDLECFQGPEARALAKQVERIFLYSEADFLKNVQLIDTPGELGTRLGKVDVKADALIRAIPYCAELNDQINLEQFGDETRPFGSSAYNSIAVIQMWDEQWPTETEGDPFAYDPYESAVNRAVLQQDLLCDSVSVVQPVSGLLALFSKDATESCLNAILSLAQEASNDDMCKMVQSYSDFSSYGRQEVYQSVERGLGYNNGGAWAALKMALWVTHRHQPSSAQELCEQLHALSHIDQLKEILVNRFFALSELIHTGSQLNKALLPCDKALNRLQAKRENNQLLIKDGDDALQLLDADGKNSTDVKLIMKTYIRTMQSKIEKELDWIEATLQKTEPLNREIKFGFNMVQREITFLIQLEEDKDLTDQLQKDNLLSEVQHIFGQYGFEVHHRLNCATDASLDELETKTWLLHDSWKRSPHCLPYEMHKALIDRLDAILNSLSTLIFVDEPQKKV